MEQEACMWHNKEKSFLEKFLKMQNVHQKYPLGKWYIWLL